MHARVLDGEWVGNATYKHVSKAYTTTAYIQISKGCPVSNIEPHKYPSMIYLSIVT
jgi:hypothetical protein